MRESGPDVGQCADRERWRPYEGGPLETDALVNEWGDLISQRRAGTTRYYDYDALGSTDALLSDAEAETDAYQYKAFGELNASTGATPNPFVFVGQQSYYRDSEIGLYLCSPGSETHRYYDPTH